MTISCVVFDILLKLSLNFFGTVLHVLYKLLVDKIPTVHVT